jgi:tripartite-type tricarboxylate transporter receptor subunit TctC
MKRARLPMLAALIFTLTSAPIVRAQDYPVRTVTIIVPFAVGGTIRDQLSLAVTIISADR